MRFSAASARALVFAIEVVKWLMPRALALLVRPPICLARPGEGPIKSQLRLYCGTWRSSA
jgi:hypothetical protein